MKTPPKPNEEKKKALTREDIMHAIRGYLVPTLSVVILLAVVFVVMLPAIDSIGEYSAQIKERESEIAQLESFIVELEMLSVNEPTIVANNNIVDKYLPKESRVSNLIDNVNTLASNAGLEATELTGSETETSLSNEESAGLEIVGETAEETKQVDEPRRVLVDFSYSGSFEEVYSLFEEINNFKELLSVESVMFEKQVDEWNVEITIASYNLSDETLDNVVSELKSTNYGETIPTVKEDVLEKIKERV